ncbi:MAG: extracellular solute-binding protein, partial [Chloroflexi bacterium]|nr:extracellular solute-binding protein [Chloroflexota bacterium]
QKTNAAIQAGATPDMVIGNPGDLATYDTAGAVVDLTSYINGADGLSAAQQSEINKSLYFDTWNNKIIGVSWGRSAQVLFYNVEALNAAGFAKPPETWDDFDAVCAKVTTPTFSCYAFVSSTSTFASMVWSRGGNYASADEKKAVFDEQAGVDTLKWLKNAAEKKYAYSPSASFGDQTDFGNGKVLFTFGSTAGLPFYYTAVKGSAKPFKWDIAAMPRGPNGKNNVDIFGPSVGVLKSNADKQKGAWLFIKYLLTPDAELDWAANVNYFPATKSAIDATVALDDAKAKALAPAFPDYLPQFKSGLQFFATIGRREPTAPAWQAVRGIIANMNTAVFLQKTGPDFKAIDPAEAAKEGVQRVNDALASFGK